MNVLDKPVLGNTNVDSRFIITQQLPVDNVSGKKVSAKNIAIGLLLAVLFIKVVGK